MRTVYKEVINHSGKHIKMNPDSKILHVDMQLRKNGLTVGQFKTIKSAKACVELLEFG